MAVGLYHGVTFFWAIRSRTVGDFVVADVAFVAGLTSYRSFKNLMVLLSNYVSHSICQTSRR